MSNFKKALSIFLCMVMLLGTVAIGVSASAELYDGSAVDDYALNEGRGTFMYVGAEVYDAAGNLITGKVVAGETFTLRYYLKGNVKLGYYDKNLNAKEQAPIIAFYVDSSMFEIECADDEDENCKVYEDPDDLIGTSAASYLWKEQENEETGDPELVALQGLLDESGTALYDKDTTDKWTVVKYTFNDNKADPTADSPISGDDLYVDFKLKVKSGLAAGTTGSVNTPESFYSTYCGKTSFAKMAIFRPTDTEDVKTPNNGVNAVEEFINDAQLNFEVVDADETNRETVKVTVNLDGEDTKYDIPVGANVYDFLKNEKVNFYRLLDAENKETKYVRANKDGQVVKAVRGEEITLNLDTDSGTIEGATQFTIHRGDFIDVASLNSAEPQKSGMAFAKWDLDGTEADPEGNEITVKAVYGLKIEVYALSKNGEDVFINSYAFTSEEAADRNTARKSLYLSVQKDLVAAKDTLPDSLGFTPVVSAGYFTLDELSTEAAITKVLLKRVDASSEDGYSDVGSVGTLTGDHAKLYVNLSVAYNVEINKPYLDSDGNPAEGDATTYTETKYYDFPAYTTIDYNNFKVIIDSKKVDSRSYNSNAYTRSFVAENAADAVSENALGQITIANTAFDEDGKAVINEVFTGKSFKVQFDAISGATNDMMFNLDDTVKPSEFTTFSGNGKEFTIADLIEDATITGINSLKGKQLVGLYQTSEKNTENFLDVKKEDEDNPERVTSATLKADASFKLTANSVKSTGTVIYDKDKATYTTFSLYTDFQDVEYPVTFYYKSADGQWKEIDSVTYTGNQKVLYSNIAAAAALVADGQGVTGDCDETLVPTQKFSAQPDGDAMSDIESSNGITEYYLVYDSASRYYYIDYQGYQYTPAVSDAPKYGDIIYNEDWQNVESIKTEPAINKAVDHYSPASEPDITEVVDDDGETVYAQLTWKKGDGALPAGQYAYDTSKATIITEENAEENTEYGVFYQKTWKRWDDSLPTGQYAYDTATATIMTNVNAADETPYGIYYSKTWTKGDEPLPEDEFIYVNGLINTKGDGNAASYEKEPVEGKTYDVYRWETWKKGDAALTGGKVAYDAAKGKVITADKAVDGVVYKVYNESKDGSNNWIYYPTVNTSTLVIDTDSPVINTNKEAGDDCGAVYDTDNPKLTDPKGSEKGRTDRNTEFIGWKYYYLEGVYSTWEEVAAKKDEWKEGWPEESKSDNGSYTATQTHIAQAQWISDDDFLFRVYTSGTLKIGLTKKFKLYYWNKGDAAGTSVPCEKEDLVMNDSPNSTIILFYKPVIEKNTYKDKDGNSRTDKYLRFESVVLNTSSLNIGGYLSIINLALDLAKGAI